MFATKFSSVSGRTDHADNGDEFLCQILNRVAPSHKFDSIDIKKAVTRLSTGLGFDDIHSNHLKFASRDIYEILAQFFNSCLIHGHIPEKMLKRVIVPTVKDRFGDKSSVDNFREIMNSSCFFLFF